MQYIKNLIKNGINDLSLISFLKSGVLIIKGKIKIDTNTKQ